MNSTTTLEQHYAVDGLRARLEASLEHAGLATGPIEWTQLDQLDQFHTRGLIAVKELADLLNPNAGQSVLDLGSGFGGPARYLAAVRGCNVTGIELTQDYVDISNYLSERTQLSLKTSFKQGDAVDLPFDSSSFDNAWTLHVSMNIRDKDKFYAGIFRVLKPGGKLAIYDVAKGDGGQVIYPAPWAPVEEFSFLSTPAETQDQLKAAGFEIIVFEDATAEAVRWLTEIQAASPARQATPNNVNLPEVIGPSIRPMLKNMSQNFIEKRTRLVRALVQKI